LIAFNQSFKRLERIRFPLAVSLAPALLSYTFLDALALVMFPIQWLTEKASISY
jgi:hypothetical protein